MLEPLDGAIVDPPEGVELDPTRIVRIGRAGSAELKVHDQHVELHHARFYFDATREQWVIEDLKSGPGTFVNGECLRGAAKVVKPGAELRFGDTRIRFKRGMWRLPWWALAAGGIAALLVFIALVLLFWMVTRTSAVHTITMGNDGVLTPRGRRMELQADAEFLRARGLSWNLKFQQKTDGDDNGIDEVWLDVDGHQQLVITFDQNERWVELGLMPAGGVPSKEGRGFPEVEIRGERWRMDPKSGKYRAFEHDAPVVWYREGKEPPPAPKPEKPKPKAKAEPAPVPPPVPQEVEKIEALGGIEPLPPLKATRLSLRDETLLGQFLSERGVHVPVHYIICEGAFDGIQAQALTYEGEVLPLEPGCINELHMEGILGKPYAIALTPAGWRALVDDVVTYYTGSPEGLFVDGSTRSVVEQVRQDPGFQRTGRLFARPANPVPGHNPIPPIGAEAPGIHPLIPTRYAAPAPRAQTVIIPGPHQPYQFRIAGPEGCEVIQVTLDDFEPGWFGGTFATIEEVGCGSPKTVLTTPHAPGVYSGQAGGHPIRFEVEADTLVGKAKRVRRARLSWR